MRRKKANTKADVYWVPIYEVLEGAGIEAFSFDGRQTRHVSGRKTDVLDCQWSQRTLTSLQRSARHLGLQLLDASTGELLGA